MELGQILEFTFLIFFWLIDVMNVQCTQKNVGYTTKVSEYSNRFAYFDFEVMLDFCVLAQFLLPLSSDCKPLTSAMQS